jgi:hypothetical protein
MSNHGLERKLFNLDQGGLALKRNYPLFGRVAKAFLWPIQKPQECLFEAEASLPL